MKTTKICIKCNQSKEFSEFYKRKEAIDGFRGSCKICFLVEKQAKNRTKKGLVTRIYGNQRNSAKERGHELPTYTNKELREWLFSQSLFHILYDNWKRLDYQTEYVPSVDRKNDYISYTMSNIQLITWDENRRKGHSDMKSGKNTKTSKKVSQYTKEGELIKTHYSIHEAGRCTGVGFQNISKCCNGKRKSIGGFVWRFANDN